MDLYEKLTSGLEPLGGKLFVDDFLAAMREAARRQKEAARAARPVPASPAPRPAPAGRPEPPAVGSDSGKLRLEVEDFMNRDDPVSSDEAEIQEFLQEKKGFDPTEFD